MNQVFSKLTKPKFRPDRMKAQSQLTQALLGNISIQGATSGPGSNSTSGSAKMKKQTEILNKENLQKLSKIIKTETSAFPTFP